MLAFEDAGDVEDLGPEGLGELAARVVRALGERNLTVGTAESCTGGLVSAALTSVPGSSAVVRGGVVSYAIPVKHEVLGVSSKVLDEPSLGAVSGECASQMATGARRVLGSDVAVSTTGIAGPTGAEPGKPVGTVWFGACAGNRVVTECHLLSGDRRTVRAKAVRIALGLVLEVTENS
jgi:nicotinamide-nucleotide amidase